MEYIHSEGGVTAKHFFHDVFGSWEEICIDNGKKLFLQSSILYFLVALVATVMAAANIVVKAYPMLLATLAILLGSAGCLVMQVVKKKYYVIVAIIFISILYVCGGYFLVSGGSDGFSVFWVVIVPPMTFVVCPKKVASLFVASGFLAVLVVFYTPLNALIQYDYSDFFDKRFPILLSLAILLTLLYEFINWKTQYLLIHVNQSLEETAAKDTLTGLLNRRSFESVMDEALSEARRRKDLKLYLLLIDLDHFKKINDTYGHSAGDDVLVGIAKVLNKMSRSSDSVFRWGGEEFLLVLKAKEDADAKTVAERIHKGVQSEVFALGEAELQMTVSIGFHAYDVNLSVSQNVNMADSYMYQAKRTGRNKIIGQGNETGINCQTINAI